MDILEGKSIRHGTLPHQKGIQEGHAGEQKCRTIVVAVHSENVR